MKNRSVSIRLVTATLIISAIAAIAAVSALGAPSPAVKAFDSVKEFFGMAPTSQSVTAAPNQRLNNVANGSMFTQPMAARFFSTSLSLASLGTAVTENFNGLPTTGTPTWTNDSTVSGVYTARTGNGTTIVPDVGTNTGGNLYSYASAAVPADRALGSIGSSNAAAGNFFYGERLINNTGSTITALNVSYAGEQWRNGAAAAQTIAFSYLIGSPNVTGSLAEFQSAGVAVTSLDFTSPITGGTAGSLDGNAAANRTVKTFTITGLSIPNGTQIMLRWSDPDHTGTDHGLSIDDLSVTATTSPSVTTSAATSVTTTAATMNGNVTSDGGATITERGFYWKSGTGVTTGNGTKVVVSGTTGTYSSNLSLLSPSTQYSYIAFATNSVGTTVSSPETTFTTAAPASLDTTTTVTSTVNPTTYGGSTTFTATTLTTLTSTAVAVGTLTIYNNNACSGTSLASGTPNASGQISVSVSTLDAPSQSIIACYTAGTGFNSSTSSVLTQTVDKANQTITVDPAVASNEYLSSGTSGIFTAATTSPLTVSVESLTTSVCTVTSTSADRATLVGLGTCTLRWTQAGNGNYNAATAVERSFQVNASPTTTTVTSSAAGAVTYGTSVTFTATIRYQGSPTAHPAGGSFKFVNGADCSATQLQAASAINGSGVVLFTSSTLAVGTYDVRACFIPSSGNELASEAVVSQQITIADQAALVITDPSPVTYGTTPPLATTGGSTAGTVTWSHGASDGCSVDTNTGVLTVISVAGTCSVTATMAGNTNYNPITSAARTITRAKATPTIDTAPTASNITYGQTLASSVLSGGAATPSGGAFTFTTPSTQPATGTASHGITYTPTDTANYNNATGSVSVTVIKATPTVTTAPTASDIVEGQSLASSVLSGGSASVAGAFTFTTPSTVPPVGTNSQPVTFTPSDTTNYNNASTSTNVTVNAAPTTYTLTATAGANGTISSPGATVVSPGANKTYTITPGFGYQIADVAVDGGSIGRVTSHTFTNVQANHTIAATFETVTNRTLTAGTLNSYYDAVIDVPVSIDDTTGANIISTDFSLNYDSTKLAPVLVPSTTKVVTTNGTVGRDKFTTNVVSPGVINIGWADTIPLSGSGVLVYIKMRVTAHATTTAALTIAPNTLGAGYFNGGAVGANAPVAGVVNINPTATTTSVVTSGTPSTYGNSVTFTATVATAGTPAVSGGAVTFYDGGASCASPGTALGAPVNINGSGVAAISTSALFAGTHTIRACYGGTSDFTASGGSVAQVVNKLAVTVTAVAATKTYDGDTSSAGVPTVSPALISGDTSSFIQTYDNRNAGTGKTLTPSGTISDGNGGNNYDITFTPVTTGVINKLAITVTAVTDTKTYDGGTTSAGVPTVSPSVISPDAASFIQTFDNRNSGTGKTLTPSGTIDDANSGNNYTITFTAVTTGVINKLAVTVTAVAGTKTYDGNTSSAGVPTVSPAVISPDAGTFIQTYDTRDAGTGKTLTPSGSIDDANSGNNYTITFTAVTTGVINKLAVTVTAVAATKTYDGGTSSAGVPTVSPSIIAPDAGTFVQTYDNRNAGTGKTLTPSGSINDGNSGGNYDITFTAVTTGVINKLGLTVTAVTDTKTYDGSTSSVGVPTVSPAVIGPDTAAFVQAFDTRNAGTGKTLTPSGSVNDGNSGNNYSYTFVADNTGVINKLAIAVTAVSSTKTYDGNTSSAGVPTVSPSVISPDAAAFVQTFDNRNAGTGKTLTPSGTVNDGNNGDNYAVTFNAVTTGTINKLAISVTAVAATKTYDGGTSSAGVPTVSPSVIAPDAASFIQTYDNRNAGTGKTLTPSGSINDGNSGGNYDITFNAVNTGVINKLAVTVTAVTDTKTYDGSTSSTGVPTVSPALISPDSGTFSQAFDTRDAGTGKTLTPSGTISDGNSGNNYDLTFASVNTGVINKLAVTVTAVSDTKTYDGNTGSAGVPTVSPSLILPDSGAFIQTFNNRNAGTGKTLTPSGTITDGNNGGNYDVTFTPVNTGVINKLAITVTAVAATKTYDGGTSSAGVPTVSPSVIAPDAASFIQTYDNRNAGTGKTLTPSGSINDGNSGNNYDITFTAVNTGVINKLAITVTAVTSTKTYDANASSTGVPTVSPALISPDSGVFTQTFDTANVGTNKTLTPAGTITDGNSGNNYAVTFTTVSTGTINRADAVCTVTGYTVPYDGNAHLATGSCVGVLGETLAGLDLSGTSHVDPGTYTDTWTFTDVTGNYNDTSGQVTDTITAGEINGTILYYGGSNSPVSDVTVAGAGSLPVSGSTNASGYYSIPGFGTGAYTMTPSRATQLCDTQNGVLIDDAAMVSEYVVGLTPLSNAQKLAAKVSGTATTNLSSFDAALIAQKSVGICNSPNIAGQWKFAPATRSHATVTGTLTDDYTGYLMGDVNGDWSSTASPNLANPESASPNAVRASLPVGNAQPGTEVTVPFRIDNLGGRSLNSYQFSVAYDPAVIAPADESANVDGTLSGNLNAVYNTPTPGLLRVGVYGAFPTQGDGVYVNLKFRVIGNNGSSSPLNISGFRFNHGTDEVTSVNGRITVGAMTPDATLQGRVTALGGRGVTGARVIVTSGSGTTRNMFTTRNGFFSFGGLAIGETYTVTIQSRRFVFTPRAVTMNDSVTNVDFIAEQ